MKNGNDIIDKVKQTFGDRCLVRYVDYFGEPTLMGTDYILMMKLSYIENRKNGIETSDEHRCQLIADEYFFRYVEPSIDGLFELYDTEFNLENLVKVVKRLKYWFGEYSYVGVIEKNIMELVFRD